MDRNCHQDEQGERPNVAPRRGAWIEITFIDLNYQIHAVAPRRGAWIEIYNREGSATLKAVAPRRGAWIEI